MFVPSFNVINGPVADALHITSIILAHILENRKDKDDTLKKIRC